MRVFFIGISLLLVSCATTHEPIELTAELREKWVKDTKTRINHIQKLALVSSKILTEGKRYCENHDHIGPYIGINTLSNQIFEKHWHELALSEFSLSEETQILFVNPSSPADSAGLKVGDIVYEVNRQSIKSMAHFEKLIKETVVIEDPITFTIRREGEYRDVSVIPSIACKSQVKYLDDNHVSFTWEEPDLNIVIYKGVMENFESDEEIAMAVSHQLAHNARQHWKANDVYGYMTGAGLGLLGFVGDFANALITGGSSYEESYMMGGWKDGRMIGNSISVEQELQADYDALHLMVIAGYEIENASRFWSKYEEKAVPRIMSSSSKYETIAKKEPIPSKYLHPIIKDRSVKIEVMINEIKEKTRSNSSLIP
ncbi:MAG: M48 family metallopeptidase [Rickettsiales bacterium]